MSNPELPTYSLYIHPSQIRELAKDWDPVMGRLTADSVHYAVEVAYRGSHIRTFKKKSYTLQFHRPLTMRGEREIHLNAEFADPSLIRNKLSFDFFKKIGTLAPDANYVFLKINGAPAGIYLRLESVDDQFLKKRDLPIGSIHYAINDDANFSLLSPITKDAKTSLEDGYERKHGTEADDEHLRSLIYTINMTPKDRFREEIARHVAIEPYLKWLIGVVCTQNFDAFIQNYALYRNPETSQFQLIPWDYDATWGRDVHGKHMPHDYIPITGYNTLTARLLDVPEYRTLYRDLLTNVLETTFTREALEPHLSELFQTIRPAIVQDPYKKNRLEEFNAEFDLILRYINDRRRYLLDRLSTLTKS